MDTKDKNRKTDEQEQEYAFIRQEVRPKRGRKFLKKLFSGMLLVIPLALLFGFLAFLSFRITQKYLMPETTTVTETETFSIETTERTTEPPTETTTEAETESESETETETEDPTRAIRDFYAVFRGITSKAGSSIVTVTSVTNGSDWFFNESEKTDKSFGLILAENSQALLILTPYDPIAEANEVWVTFRNGSEVEAVKYSSDQELGLSCVEVELENIPPEARASYQTAVLGDSLGLNAGVPVIAVGAPNGYVNSVDFGFISNRKTTESIIDNEIELFNTSMPDHANSSGVIVDLNGSVVGMLTHRFDTNLNEGLSTCYSINSLSQLVTDLAMKAERPYLGIYGSVVQGNIGSTLGVAEGIYVYKVVKESPAYAAGIERGDIIVSIDDKPIADFPDLQSAIREAGAEETVTVQVVRTTRTTDNELTFEVTLGRR